MASDRYRSCPDRVPADTGVVQRVKADRVAMAAARQWWVRLDKDGNPEPEHEQPGNRLAELYQKGFQFGADGGRINDNYKVWNIPQKALDQIDYFHGMTRGGQNAIAKMENDDSCLDAEMISLTGSTARCIRTWHKVFRQRLYNRLYIQRGIALARGGGSLARGGGSLTRVGAALDDGPLLKSLALYDGPLLRKKLQLSRGMRVVGP